MNYQEFKANFSIGSSVASPEGTYFGECVSYVRQYMALVDGFKSGPIGHAAQIPDNATFLSSYEKVSTPQVGDLVFWGNDAGNITSEYGHTGVVDGGGYMMNQNYGGSRKVSRNAIFQGGLIGYYRLKGIGGAEVITKENFVQGAQATGFMWGKDFNYDANMPLDQFVQLLDGNAPRITKDMERQVADAITGIESVVGDGYNSRFVGQKVVTHYPAMVAFWSGQPKAGTKSAARLKPGLYEVK